MYTKELNQRDHLGCNKKYEHECLKSNGRNESKLQGLNHINYASQVNIQPWKVITFRHLEA